MIRQLSCLVLLLSPPAFAQEPSPSGSSLADSLRFYAPFDGHYDAIVASGDKRLFTAEKIDRQAVSPGQTREDVSLLANQGRFGDCLHFAGRSDKVLFFQGDNFPYQVSNWSGTVSFWLRLNPDEDLLPGYCDPIQITQHGWNNGAFFVDFDRDLPRDFRLGVFSDYKVWNPTDISWDKLPVEERPMVVVKKPPFSRTEWTHVAWTFANGNPENDTPAHIAFYLNGKPQGERNQLLRMNWDIPNTTIMLGIEYIGDMDELMIFDRALSAEEVAQLHKLDKPLITPTK